ncbi:hypothetical protein RFI_17350 [Reticulomyxa filosa]|uniref:Uncharacterized protein n=1 Tax=Reticulomyxa filosa TaxID=46433 RepID=X6N2D9_RETFI|nr:hypothetical protein RFI_17350 [Reticulomyxa filosa]|eukprot:ETO19879.1 hypothetical protein RFI_17350 [Reticulomyxa filosa]
MTKRGNIQKDKMPKLGHFGDYRWYMDDQSIQTASDLGSHEQFKELRTLMLNGTLRASHFIMHSILMAFCKFEQDKTIQIFSLVSIFIIYWNSAGQNLDAKDLLQFLQECRDLKYTLQDSQLQSTFDCLSEHLEKCPNESASLQQEIQTKLEELKLRLNLDHDSIALSKRVVASTIDKSPSLPHKRYLALPIGTRVCLCNLTTDIQYNDQQAEITGQLDSQSLHYPVSVSIKDPKTNQYNIHYVTVPFQNVRPLTLHFFPGSNQDNHLHFPTAQPASVTPNELSHIW